jgi:hypothetical protein
MVTAHLICISIADPFLVVVVKVHQIGPPWARAMLENLFV